MEQSYGIAGIELFALIGFALAAYSIVANDAIQTLGTFLSSNSRRPWVVLWAFSSAVIVGVMIFGWFSNAGDIAFERLNRIPYPEIYLDQSRPQWWARFDPPGGVEWYHVAPPLTLLLLTRFGIPVSTTFLVLTVFALTGGAATDGVLTSMLIKSGIGYMVALLAGFLVYVAVSRAYERWIANTHSQPHHPIWYVLQWCATGYLWWNWLAQDLANIFVFLPRETVTSAAGVTQVTFDPTMVVLATGLMVLLSGYIFATRGGEIQKIVLTKTNTTDVRAATLVDFIYGTVLLYFKELNDVPMSTTWVFLGLLAGREIAITAMIRLRPFGAAVFDVASDAMRALVGLFISVFLAIAIPAAAGSPNAVDVGPVTLGALVAAAFVCWGVMWALRRQAEAANVEQAA